MLSEEQVINLLYTEAFKEQGRKPLYIWVIGLPGAGKTFVSEILKRGLEKKGSVGIFVDAEQLVREVEKDAEGKYHVKYPGWFLVTSHIVDDRVHDELKKRANEFGGDYFLIELARGRDIEGERDLSFRRLSRILDGKLLRNSIFIYLHCPYTERLKRLQWRKEEEIGGYTTAWDRIIMERFFQEDDFEEWQSTVQSPLIVLDNL